MKVAVIGTGYIGISTALHFVKVGVEVVGIDIDKDKIKTLREGELPQKDLLEWLDFDPKPLLQKVRFYNFFLGIGEGIFDAIFIAVPTEKDGEPYFEALEEVIKTIHQSINKETLTIIESTLMPGVSDKHIAPYLPNFAIAPRRDWFTDKGKTVKTLPRIVGGNTEENTQKAGDILHTICMELHYCNCREAELVKSLENSIRHLEAVYSQELAWAYPELDIRKVLKLAGTKWNITKDLYPNALGTSGYCIPLSSRYVVKGSNNDEHLHIARNSIISDDETSYKVARLLKDINPKSIGILGIAYLADIKVSILSGAMRLLKYFKDEKVMEVGRDDIVTMQRTFEGIIKVNDPLYTDKELKKITGLETFNFPDDLDKFEILILTAGHKFYTNHGQIMNDCIIEKTKNCRFILDNVGIWEGINFKCPYILPGRKDWISKIK